MDEQRRGISGQRQTRHKGEARWVEDRVHILPWQNTVSCKLFTGLTWTPLVSAYLPPSTLEQLPDMEEALKSGKDPIFHGDLNVELDKARSPRIQQVA